MRRVEAFSESFFDGFTMAGFLRKLPRPGAASEMFAPAIQDSDVTEELQRLRSVQLAQQQEIEALRRRVESFSALEGKLAKAGHGTTR